MKGNALLDRLPYDPENKTKLWGADGSKRPRQQWFNSDESELPPPYVPPPEGRPGNMPSDLLENSRKFLEQRSRSDELQVMSDYDFGLK